MPVRRRTTEEEAAEYIGADVSRQVFGVTLGAAPPGKQMGRAGAIISGGRGTYDCEVRTLEAAGVPTGRAADELASLVAEVFSGTR